jgi:N-acetylmuramoyl-L-alanine amidase
MSKYIWLIDNGHGGEVNGVPQTAGKRSPNWGEGVLIEGTKNREIAKEILKGLKKNCIDCVELTPELADVSLSQRVKRANALAKFPAVLLSVHCDGFPKESAHGFSAYTYHGQSDSDKIAEIICRKALAAGLHLRADDSDGDLDKEANLAVLRDTVIPAVLIENLFMTNKKDYNVLMSKKGVKSLAKITVDAIKEIEKNGI